MLGTHVHWLGGDDSERLAVAFNLSGHLAPGADVADGSCHISLSKDSQNRKKVAAMKKKRSQFHLFLNLAGFCSGDAQQPSWTWKQMEHIKRQTPSEGWSTACPAEGDRKLKLRDGAEGKAREASVVKATWNKVQMGLQC